MTEDEMAEEYANNEINKMFVDESEEVYVRASTLKQIIKNSHLKGLAEGKDMAETDLATAAYMQGTERYKTKWHKVADGDLPPCEKGGFTVNVFTDRGEIAYYNHFLDSWIAEPASVEIDPPIAWCELPKFEE